MEVNVDLCSPENARKKQRQPENWKVTKQKLQRYSPKAMPNYPTCGHRGKCLNCSLLTMVDIKEFHAAFYTVRTKMSQDAFILKYCSVSTPVRYRPRSGDRGKKTIKYKYFVKNQVGNRIEVCRRAFLGILGITKHRVEGVFTRFKKEGSDIPVETRGGFRKDCNDRVFGGIEREINKKEKIVKVEEYHESFSGHGTVKKLGKL
ncbi:uncharacterized protein LOC124358283 [Homalodisca vitripennis]|uniref:uncharacterized protein LOC124358283 n=1 Tax=Homalodisca vitripennis TaxID=197043 RepID=UPI001EE9BD44|nr:uncharacterized protein LOC124358283 [Homalodisca vitripennis]